MNHVAMRGMRTGAIVLLATLLVCGVSRQGAAQTVERNSSQSRATRASAEPAVSSNQQARLGPMRYYGGPKSPMWRAPAN
jgi:hypothetical protein